jgi:hypothetical protein
MTERPDIVPIGQIPEFGVVPNRMHSSVIRPERFGEPTKAFALAMRQKQIIGSHFADADSAGRANRLMIQGKVKPVMTRLFQWDEIAQAHQLMYQNQIDGTVSALVGAPRPGLRNLEETRAAIANG